MAAINPFSAVLFALQMALSALPFIQSAVSSVNGQKALKDVEVALQAAISSVQAAEQEAQAQG